MLRAHSLEEETSVVLREPSADHSQRSNHTAVVVSTTEANILPNGRIQYIFGVSYLVN